MLLFPAFESLDVFGPLDALQILSRLYKMDLALISTDLDPVSTKTPHMNPKNSTFGANILPTHTFENAPALDVLIVPGGVGSRARNLNSTVDYIAKTYPKLQYLISICSGAILVSDAKVLAGKTATTNKASWDSIVVRHPEVNWVKPARWTQDGNIWTSSGISSSIDVTIAWIASTYGESVAQNVSDTMEYERHTDPSWDPWGK